MTIHYALFENHLTSDPADYAAIVKPAGGNRRVKWAHLGT